MSAGARRNRVGTYLGPRTFYDKDMARRHRASQRTALPPRCTHCRLPGTVMINETPHCGDHSTGCLGGCTGDETVLQ